MKIFVQTFTILLLASNALCVSEFFSFEQFEKLFQKKQNDISIERLLGNWHLTGVALASAEIQNILGAATGYYPNGVRNRDKSRRAVLHIKRQEEASKNLNITIKGIGRADVQQGPKHLDLSTKSNRLTFAIQAYDHAETVNSHFQYTCKYIWAEKESEDCLLCAIEFVPHPKETWADEMMKLKNIRLAFYKFLKAPN